MATRRRRTRSVKPREERAVDRFQDSLEELTALGLTPGHTGNFVTTPSTETSV